MVKKTTTAAPAAARLKKAVAGFKARLKGLEVTADKTADEADEADAKEALKAAASVLTLAAVTLAAATLAAVTLMAT